MGRHSAPEPAADTRRIPMRSPGGHRTRFVSPSEADQLAAKGWTCNTDDLWHRDDADEA